MRTSTRRSIVAVAWLAAGALAPRTGAVELQLDSTFGVNGTARTAFGSNYSDDPRDLLIQPDGKILTAGSSTGGAGIFVAISRHSADGVLDSTGFGTDGKVFVHWVLRDQANAIALQEDGKIVAVGMQMTSNGVSTQRQAVYRFHADGAVDTAFGDSGCVTEWGDYETGEKAAVKVLPDGTILAGGRRHPGYWGGFTAFSMRRYLPDGTLMMGGGIEFSIDRIRGSCAFPDDGGIIIANLAYLNGRREFVMARLDSLGNPDAGFGTGGVVQTGIEAVFNTVLRALVLSDGKILLVGTTPGTGTSNWTALRFNSDGTPDDLFGTNGRTDVSFGDLYGNSGCYDATIDAGGKILLAGRAGGGGGEPALARLLPNGGPDSTFSGDGKLVTNLNGYCGTHYFTRVLVLPDGRILTAGFDSCSGGGDFFLARFWPSAPTGVDEAEALPTRAAIRPSPNPSRGEMAIHFGLSRSEPVTIDVFDVAGRVVRRIQDGELPAGMHEVRWDGRDASGREAPTGVYFTRVVTSEGSRTLKLIRLR